jgi:ribosomal protein S12 methylthiotransferase accessory factor
MIARPQLSPHVRAYVESTARAYILAENGTIALRGILYPRLLPLLDGTRTVSEIVSALGAEAGLVCLALDRLETRRLLCEGELSMPQGTAAFASALGVDPGRAAQRIAARSVCVRAIGHTGIRSVEERLQACGLRTTRHEAEAALVVVLSDHYFRPELAELNRRALEAKRPWLLLGLGGAAPWLGPLFVPGVTGCQACLNHRLRLNCSVEARLHEDADPARPLPSRPASLPAIEEAGLALAVAEVTKWVLLAPSEWSRWPEGLTDRLGLLGHVVVLAGDSLTLQRHPLTRRPQCPACGRPEPSPLGPIVLQSRPTVFTEDGGHRSLTPEETVRRLVRHVSPITGLVPALRRRGATGSPVVAYSTDSHTWVGRRPDGQLAARHSNAGGKGKSDQQALASALCESLERYSAGFAGDETRIRARAADLEGAIRPAEVLHFSEAQYRNREQWNRDQMDGSSWIPEPYDERTAIDWTPVWSLRSGTTRYLPTAFCYSEYYPVDTPQCCFADSNGNAAGNNLEEAILQGFFELVERDSVALWWFNRVRRPGVDLAGFGEPYLVELAEYYRSMRRELWAIDVTSDLGIPAFAALLRCLDGPSERIVTGFGAHVSARLALLRAATEVNQAAVGRGVLGDSGINAGDPNGDSWLREATVAQHPYLLPDSHAPVGTARSFPDLCRDDLRNEILCCVEIAARHNLDVLVLDQTRPDVGLAAVKVVVPGLRHFWPRYGPGRLYDVPVKLGWLTTPRAECDLNPTVATF